MRAYLFFAVFLANTHQKVAFWGCFGIFRISSCWLAQRFSKLMQKWLRKLKLKLTLWTQNISEDKHRHLILYCCRAILKLFVQASKCHRNPWKSHFLPQKVPQSTIWNGSSVKWTLVDLDFAFVNDFQFSVCPSATKMNYKCSYFE